MKKSTRQLNKKLLDSLNHENRPRGSRFVRATAMSLALLFLLSTMLTPMGNLWGMAETGSDDHELQPEPSQESTPEPSPEPDLSPEGDIEIEAPQDDPETTDDEDRSEDNNFPLSQDNDSVPLPEPSTCDCEVMCIIYIYEDSEAELLINEDCPVCSAILPDDWTMDDFDTDGKLLVCEAEPVEIEAAITTRANLQSAITGATGTRANPTVITITGNFNVDVSLDVNNRHVRIQSDGTRRTLTRSTTQDWGMFRVRGGGTLVLSNIIIDGNNVGANGDNSDRAAGVLLENGRFQMEANTILRRHRSSGRVGRFSVGAVLVRGANSEFIMNGGEIENNVVPNDTSANPYQAGGIYINSGGRFTMNGGTISGNEASSGGINIQDNDAGTANSQINLRGGTITGNRAQNAGVHSGGIGSRGANPWRTGNFRLSGNINVSGNTQGTAARNIYIPPDQTITIDGAINAASRIGIMPGGTLPQNFATGANTGFPNTDAWYHVFIPDNTGHRIVRDGNTMRVMAATNYTITFDRNGGTGGEATRTVGYGNAFAQMTSIPTRAGFTFNGYWTAATGGTRILNNNGTAVDRVLNYTYTNRTNANAVDWIRPANTTLFAQWTVNTYASTINNTGTAYYEPSTVISAPTGTITGGATSVTFTFNAQIPSPVSVPSRTGYTFMGYWSTNAATGGTQFYTNTGVRAFTTNYTTAAATPLFARWRANSNTITFNHSNGTGGTTTATAFYDVAMPSITLPTRAGWTFHGYFTEANGGGTQYYTSTGASSRNWNLTANITLFAHWTANNYNVSFNHHGGSGGPGTLSVVFASAMPTITPPTRTGFTFNGYWSAEIDGTRYFNNNGTGARNWDIAAAATLHAHWTPINYSITLNPQGGSGGTANVTAAFGSPMPLITRPTRTGHTFQGYWTMPNGTGVQYYTPSGGSAQSWDITAATTLYAHWTINTNTITLDRQLGSGGVASVTATFGMAMPELAELPTRDKHAFGGYYTSPGGAGLQFYTATGESVRSWTLEADTTLYAYWIENKLPDASHTLLISVRDTVTRSFNLAALISSILPGDIDNVSYSLGKPLNPTELNLTDPNAILSTSTPPSLAGLRLYYTGNSKDSGTATLIITISSSNYVDASITVIFEATLKAVVTIDGIEINNKVYDGSPIVRGGTIVITGDTESDRVDTTGLVFLYESTDGGGYTNSAPPTDAGTYKLTVSIPYGNPEYAGTEEYDFTIYKRPLIVRADNKEARVGNALPGITISYDTGAGTGFVDPDSPGNAFSIQPVIEYQAGVSTAMPATFEINFSTYAALNNTIGKNYVLSHVYGTLTVLPKDIVTIDGLALTNKTYDGTPIAPTGSVRVDGSTASPLVASLVYSYVSTDGGSYNSNQPPTNAGSYRLTVSVSPADPIYTGTVIYDFIIFKAALTVTAVDKEVIVGGALPPATIEYEGFAQGEDADDVFSDKPFARYETGVNSDVPAIFSIIFEYGTLASGNYDVTYSYGTLTVKPKTSVTISGLTFTNKVFDGERISPSGTALVNGSNSHELITSLEYSYISTDSGGYISSGSFADAIHPLEAGSYRLIIYVPTDNPEFIGSVEYSFTILKAPLNIIAKDETIIVGAALPTPEFEYIGIIAPHTPGSVFTPPEPVAVLDAAASSAVPATFDIIFDPYAELSTGDGKNYELTHTYGTLTVLAKTEVIIGGLYFTDKFYDKQPIAPVGDVTVEGNFVDVSELVWLYESTDAGGYSDTNPPTDAGSYKLTIIVRTDDPVYTGAVEYSFTIFKAPIIINADDKTVLLGATQIPNITISIDGFVDGDDENTVFDVLPVAEFEETPSTDELAVYNIIFSEEAQLKPGLERNYTVSHITGTLTVTLADSNIFVVTANTHIYNGLPQGVSVSFISGVSVAIAGEMTVRYYGTSFTGVQYDGTTAPVEAGIYTIYVSTAGGTILDAIDDYEAGQLTISRRSVNGSQGLVEVGVFGALTYTGMPQTPSAAVSVTPVSGTPLTATGSWSQVTRIADITVFTASGNFEGQITDVSPGMLHANITAEATLNTPDGNNSWFTVRIPTLTAPDGYTISTSDTFAHNSWTSSITINNDDGINKTAIYYLRDNITGAISVAKISPYYFVDKTAPTAQVRTHPSAFREFLNSITFGLLFKNTVITTIQANDNLSGVATVQYYKSADFVADPWSITGWVTGSTFSSTANEAADDKYVLYARITDNAGNTTILLDSGVIVYYEKAYVVGGQVTDEEKQPLEEGVIVTLVRAGVPVQDSVTVGVNGVFRLENVLPGAYNLIVKHTDNSNPPKVTTITKILHVTNRDVDVGQIIVPIKVSYQVNSVFDNRTSDFPVDAVAGLNELYSSAPRAVVNENGITQQDIYDVENGGEITIRLQLNNLAADNPSDAATAIIEDNKEVAFKLEFQVFKEVLPPGEVLRITQLLQTNKPITVYIPIPADLQNRTGHVVYRIHDGKVETVPQVPYSSVLSDTHEGFAITPDGTMVVLNVYKFSVYAFGLAPLGSTQAPPPGGGTTPPTPTPQQTQTPTPTPTSVIAQTPTPEPESTTEQTPTPALTATPEQAPSPSPEDTDSVLLSPPEPIQDTDSVRLRSFLSRLLNFDTGPVLKMTLDVEIGASVSGRSISAEATGLMPGSEVSITIHSMAAGSSDAYVLATGLVNDDGSIKILTSFTEGLQGGRYVIIAEGICPDGYVVQAVAPFEIDDEGILTALIDPSQLFDPIDPSDSRLVRSLIAGVPLYDAKGDPETVTQVAVTFGLLGGIAAIAGVAKKRTNKRKAIFKNDDNEDIEQEEPVTKWGDKYGLWRISLFRKTSDKVSVKLQEKTAKTSFILNRFTGDGSWARAMFGSGGFILWVLGIALGIYSSMQVGYNAMPPTLMLVLAITALGVLDSGAGFLAWLTFTVITIANGNAASADEIRTLIGMFTLFATMLILGATRPLRRKRCHGETLAFLERLACETMGTGSADSPLSRFVFDRVADYVMPTIYILLSASAVLKAINGLSGLEFFTGSDIALIRLVAIGAYLLRMLLEDLADYAFPVRNKAVRPKETDDQSKFFQFGAMLLYAGLFMVVSSPFFGFGMAVIFILALDVVPWLLSFVKDRFPNSEFLYRYYPSTSSPQIGLALMLISFAITALIASSTDYRSASAAMILVAVPYALAEVPSLFGREDPTFRDLTDGWAKRLVEFTCWCGFAAIVLLII